MAARSTFRREAHSAVLSILQAFDPDALRRYRCFFGGGTRIAMDLDEYRESRDIDFICADPSGYGDLRSAVHDAGYAALFSLPGRATVGLPREIRADQYGVRFPVVVGKWTVRVELIREARIGLEQPIQPEWSPVECIAVTDCFAEKLLANCDRWADTDSLSKDLIDLALLRDTHGPIPDKAWRAAEGAYKGAVRKALQKATQTFSADTEHRRRCFSGLRIEAAVAKRCLSAVQLLAREAQA